MDVASAKQRIVREGITGLVTQWLPSITASPHVSLQADLLIRIQLQATM